MASDQQHHKKVYGDDIQNERESQFESVADKQPEESNVQELQNNIKQESVSIIQSAEEKTAIIAQKAKETAKLTLEKVQITAAPKLNSAKETVITNAKKTSNYLAQKGGEVKDIAVEKGAQTYDNSKDKAVVVGWGAANLTAEAAVEGTKITAKIVEGVAGYAGEAAVAIGSKVVEVGAKEMERVKDVASAAGESVKEFTAWKKEEAKREIEAKKSPDNEVRSKM